MKKVRILGKVRGFFRHLTALDCEDVRFFGDGGFYEVGGRYKALLSMLLRTRFVGFWGIFKINSAEAVSEDCDYYLSFNRFVRSDRPYIIYLENPTALCNYSLTCLQSPFVKKKLIRCLADEKLVSIVCMSKACERTAERVLGVPIPKEKLAQIYPYVPGNPLVSRQSIMERYERKPVRLLYIAQGGRFYSKGGNEIIQCFARLRRQPELSLTIITNVEMLDESTLDEIKALGIRLLDFKLSFEQMQQVYAEHSILLQPSSDDSWGLTMLEALKAGLPIISSDLYAFKEMVTPGENGYFVTPTYRLFDEQDLPNPRVWNHRRKTLYSKRLNPELADSLAGIVEKLCDDREALCRMSLVSYQKAETVFSCETILQQWNGLCSADV